MQGLLSVVGTQAKRDIVEKILDDGGFEGAFDN
jgi:hypothetical protein